MTYYKTDSRKISFGEYLNIASGFGWIVAWVYKIFGLTLTLSSGIPEQRPFRELVVDHADIPSDVMEKFSPVIVDLQRLGFSHFWFTTLKNSLLGDAAYAVQSIHSSGAATSKVAYARIQRFEVLVVAFLTEFESGNILATTNRKEDFRPPTGNKVQRKLGANIQDLWPLHRAALGKVFSSETPKLVLNFEQLAAFEDKATGRNYQDKINRGIWVPMTPEEIEALKRKRSSAPAGRA